MAIVEENAAQRQVGRGVVLNGKIRRPQPRRRLGVFEGDACIVAQQQRVLNGTLFWKAECAAMSTLNTFDHDEGGSTMHQCGTSRRCCSRLTSQEEIFGRSHRCEESTVLTVTSQVPFNGRCRTRSGRQKPRVICVTDYADDSVAQRKQLAQDESARSLA